MLLPISTLLNEKVQEIITNAEQSFFAMTLQIVSTSNPDITLDVDFIESMDINQVFAHNYTDDIEVLIRLSPEQFMMLVNNHQDLIAIIRIEYIDTDTFEPIVDRLPLVYKYKCIIKNPADLTKKFHASQLKPNESEQVEHEGHHAIHLDTVIQLIDENIYEMRKKSINTILNEVTVEDVIRYATQLFGITKIYFEPPDNVNVRRHMIITPPKTFDDIFDFLQQAYGVYYKGLEYYYTDETLYVYAPYETDPVSKSTVHIYNVPPGQYAGLRGYHIKKEDDLHILCNSRTETKNLIELGIENDGNSMIMLRADTVIDEFRQVTNEYGTQVKQDNVVTADLLSDKAMVQNTLVPKHTKPTTNLFAETSKVVKNNATMVALQWAHSVPFSIPPGQKIVYHFDDDNELYNFKTGRCESVAYQIQKTDRTDRPIFSCAATMILRIDPS